MRIKAHKSLVSNANTPSHLQERKPISAEVPSFPQKQEPIPARVPSFPRKRGSIPVDDSSFPRKRESILNSISSHLPNQTLTSAFSPSHPREQKSNPADDSSFPLSRESILGAFPSHLQNQILTSPIPPSSLQKQKSIPAEVPSFPRERESILACAAAGANPSRPTSLSLSPPHIRFAVSLILGLLLLLLLPSAVAAADGVISGTVVNGTAGGSVPADVAVTLYFLRDGEIVEQRTQVTGPEGAYRFSDLPTDPMLGFVVVAAYTQVPYNTPELKFTEGSAVQAPPLIVFEASQDASVVRVVTDVLIIAPGEESSGMLNVIEIVRLANDSDRTFLATGGAGAGAPMDRVLRFALPVDAQDLTMLSGLNAQNVVQIDRGFGVFMPLLPGEREVMFGYQLPYSGSTLSLTKRTVYPTDQFAILAREEYGLRFNADQLEVQADPIGDRRYLVGSTNALAARAEVSVQIAGLPAPSIRVRLERLFDRARDTQAALFLLLGVVLILPVLYAVYRMRGGPRRRAAATAAVATAVPAAGETLLLEIAQLDDEFAAGGIAAEEYRRLRAEKKQRLMEIHREPGKETGDE